MTINGPAPMLLAMFMNAAIDQRIERYLKSQGTWAEAEKKIQAAHARALERGLPVPHYKGALPPQHDGTGLALLGVSGEDVYKRQARCNARPSTRRVSSGSMTPSSHRRAVA